MKTPEEMRERVLHKVQQAKTPHSRNAQASGEYYYVAGIAGGKHLFEGPRTQGGAFALKTQLEQQPENQPSNLVVFESPSKTGVRDDAVREYKDKTLERTKNVGQSLHRMLRNLPDKYRR